VPKEDIQGLPPEIKKMYQDFCVLGGDHYVCPESLNQLTIAWYLNSSKTPNVAADEDLRFYAIREITAGEELTVDYDTYSENDSPES
jgi:SET domain-containing protein